MIRYTVTNKSIHIQLRHSVVFVVFSYTDSCTYIHIYAGSIPTQWIMTSEGSFRKICTSHFIVRVWKGFYCERELETEQNCNILTPTLMAVNFLVLQGCSTRGPGAQLSAECWLSLPHLVTNGSPKLLGVPRAPSAGCGFPYHILSPTSLIPNSSGAPRVPSAGLSLPHLISNFSGPQLNQGPEDPFSLAWLSLPHLVSNSNSLTSCLDWVI